LTVRVNQPIAAIYAFFRHERVRRGVGFFEAGKFLPDFIVWLLVDGRQYISFVDPKGIRKLGLPTVTGQRTAWWAWKAGKGGRNPDVPLATLTFH
jgi:hypothetical protein